MQRWHVTLGLTAAAVVAAFLAPTLLGGRPAAPPPIAPQPDRIATIPVPAVDPVVAPTSGRPLGHLKVDAGLDRTAVLSGADNERLLTVTVSAPADLGVAERRPVDLSVVMDVSGSMAARGKIDQARRAAKALAGAMAPTDTWSLVVFNDDATVVVPATSIDDPGPIQRAIDRIYEGGGTNLYAGMQKGASEIEHSRHPGVLSRVILLSDGNANIGVTDPGALSRFAADLSSRGISVSAVGLGVDYNEDLLGKIADLGGGSYHFANDGTDLAQVFTDELTRTATVVGARTTVHVELPPGVTPVEVIGWDAVRSGNGWDVFVGDVYSGDARKIVARVNVRPPSCADASCAQPRLVADVDATYADVLDGVDAHTPAQSHATVTTDARVVATSVDKVRAAAAQKAVGSWYFELSTRAYESGDAARSKDLATRSVEVLRKASVDFDAPELSDDAFGVEAAAAPMAAAPAASEAGKVQIKMNKEMVRDLAR